ncbi:MAG: rhodanese-like domain-containing protein [Alphaproteobacteria bacterium]|nr:rhodanese-like domain-containing protein [Alphaproteobacteria bacterium]
MTASASGIKARKAEGYAGDVTVQEAWAILERQPAAVLVDVRTTAEWSFVGVPDLAPLGKQPSFLAWQVFPSMQVNPDFVAALEADGIDRDAPLLFLCRSGGRSKAAAIAMTERGFTSCFNLLDGFEGAADEKGHRGTRAGWMAAGLPWKQS